MRRRQCHFAHCRRAYPCAPSLCCRSSTITHANQHRHPHRALDQATVARLRLAALLFDHRERGQAPLISLLRWVHLGVTLPIVFLSRTERCNDGGVDHGSALNIKPVSASMVRIASKILAAKSSLFRTHRKRRMEVSSGMHTALSTPANHR